MEITFISLMNALFFTSLAILLLSYTISHVYSQKKDIHSYSSS